MAVEPDRPGAKHRPGDDGGRPRRPDAEDHRRGASGEVAALADTINEMTDTLATFAEQVTGVAREVGTEGMLGGQADVPNVAGTWKDLTDNVNLMASNLTDQVRNIAAGHDGGRQRRPDAEDHGRGQGRGRRAGRHDQRDDRHAGDLRRPGHPRGPRGGHRGQARRPGRGAERRRHVEGPDRLGEPDGRATSPARCETSPRSRRRWPTATSSQKITVDVKGEILELKETINTMVDQLSSFADEVTRVAREVGTEGMLGGQAEVEGRVRHVARPDRERELSWPAT